MFQNTYVSNLCTIASLSKVRVHVSCMLLMPQNIVKVEGQASFYLGISSAKSQSFKIHHAVKSTEQQINGQVKLSKTGWCSRFCSYSSHWQNLCQQGFVAKKPGTPPRLSLLQMLPLESNSLRNFGCNPLKRSTLKQQNFAVIIDTYFFFCICPHYAQIMLIIINRGSLGLKGAFICFWVEFQPRFTLA